MVRMGSRVKEGLDCRFVVSFYCYFSDVHASRHPRECHFTCRQFSVERRSRCTALDRFSLPFLLLPEDAGCCFSFTSSPERAVRKDDDSIPHLVVQETSKPASECF